MNKMGLVTNGTHSSQMEIPNGNFPGLFVNGKRPVVLLKPIHTMTFRTNFLLFVSIWVPLK